MTPFKKRCELLNQMLLVAYDYEPYQEFINEEDLYIYCAVATSLDLIEPGEVMVAHINRVFESFVYMNKKKDTGFKTIHEIDEDLARIDFEYVQEDLKDSIEQDEYIKRGAQDERK
jgi:hypothetical protein